MLFNIIAIAVMLVLIALGLDYINAHVVAVEGPVDFAGCLTNRCVQFNDKTYLIK